MGAGTELITEPIKVAEPESRRNRHWAVHCDDPFQDRLAKVSSLHEYVGFLVYRTDSARHRIAVMHNTIEHELAVKKIQQQKMF